MKRMKLVLIKNVLCIIFKNLFICCVNKIICISYMLLVHLDYNIFCNKSILVVSRYYR